MSDSESGEAAAQAADTFSDWSEGEHTDNYQSLFTSRTFAYADGLFAFDSAEFGFDLRQYRQKASSPPVEDMQPALHTR